MTAAVKPPEAALPAQLRPWILRADRLVRGKVADAAAHAGRSITARLKRAPDGRPTARLAVQSPSYQAAAARLDELLEALAGPTTASLTGLLRDAREAFFVGALNLWRPLLDPEFYRVDVEATKEGIATVRGAILHGYDLRRELAGDWETAKRTLFVVCNLAGHSTTSVGTVDDLIEVWRRRTADRLAACCAAVLADSQLSLFWAAETAMQKGK
jgi:hypothetical protein